MLWGLYGFQSFFCFESVIAFRNSWIRNKVCDRTTGDLYLHLNTCKKHIPETTADWPPSNLSSPFESPGNKNSNKDSPALLSPSLFSFPPRCTLCKQLFSFLFCFCYVAKSMPSKDTCFVVTCKNKTTSILCMLFSISGMARSLSRGWASTQID